MIVHVLGLILMLRILDRQSNIYNDRPRMIMANEILGDGIFLPLVKYGDVYVYARCHI